MKNNAVAFSIFIAVIISVFLAFSVFWILYFYWGDASAVKDALSTVTGFFGGFATLGAAVVAGYLFNDWKDEYSQSLNGSILLDFLKELDTLEDHAESLLTELMFLSQKELDSVEATVPNMYRNDLFKIIKKHRQNYNNSQFNKWSLANKYYIIGNDYYARSICIIVGFINEAFIELDLIKNLDKYVLSIDHNSIQPYIDSAICELREGLELLSRVRSMAISDLKPHK